MAVEHLVVAIDGPAGAGKSSVSREVARRLGFTLVDTGALYRAVALRARELGVAWDDEARVARAAREMEVSFQQREGENHLLIQGEDRTLDIRSPEISQGSSQVSALPAVRAALLELQRDLAAAGAGAVLEGRDIGTVVCPRAEVKVFLTASPRERARRRWLELRQRGEVDLTLEQVLADQEERDRRDSRRQVAPLKAAPDAMILDSTALSLKQVVERILARVEERRRQP